MSVRLNVKNTHIKVNFVMFSQRRKIRNANLQKKGRARENKTTKINSKDFLFLTSKLLPIISTMNLLCVWFMSKCKEDH